VQLLPDRQADVSLRISGQITELSAKLGDSVRIGQRLGLVQSRLLGDPPASVVITAPMSGLIDVRNVIVGQAVEPNTQVLHISDRSEMIVVGKVYEEDLGKVQLGQEAHVRVLSYQQQVFAGKVTLIEPNLDPSSRTVKVWIQLPNPEGLLKPNMFATVGLILRSNESALAIPNSAILEANGEKFVFIRQGDTFDRVDIMVGASDDEYSEVTDGLDTTVKALDALGNPDQAANGVPPLEQIIIQSVTMRFGLSTTAAASAACPSGAVSTRYPSRSKQ